MLGIILIIIGGLMLLSAFGVIGPILGNGTVLGVVLILLGIMMLVRRSMRRGRRAEWIARRREIRQGGAPAAGNDQDGTSKTQ